ncbi:MAG: hypothetical protein AAGI72_17935 [Pseudomonadota bacterium]
MLAAFWAQPVFAAEQEEISDLLRLSGLSAQVRQFPEMVKVGILQAAEAEALLSDVERDQMLAGVDRAFAPEALESSIGNEVGRALSRGDITSLMAWYQSSIGKQITASEERASTPAAYAEMMRRASELAQNVELMEFAERLDQLLGATDMTLEIQKTSALAVYAALATKTAPEEPMDLLDYATQLEAMTPELRPQVKQLVHISSAFAYEGVDEASRSKYEQFLRTPAASRFNTAVMEAFVAGFSEAVSAWAAELPFLLESDSASVDWSRSPYRRFAATSPAVSSR